MKIVCFVSFLELIEILTILATNPGIVGSIPGGGVTFNFFNFPILKKNQTLQSFSHLTKTRHLLKKLECMSISN